MEAPTEVYKHSTLILKPMSLWYQKK